jgi:hypothetical protein
MAKANYNGVAYNFATISLKMFNEYIFGCSEISYSSTRNVVQNFGIGYFATSTSFDKYDNKASIGLHMEELQRLRDVAPEGRIQEIPMFDIQVSFTPPGQKPVVHTLKGCSFINDEVTGKTGDTLFLSKLDLMVSEIKFA